MENKQMVKVLFRKDKRDGEVIAVFPTLKANYGKLSSYVHMGQHGEIQLEYYQTMTVPASETEYIPLLKELTGIYDDCTLVIKKRVNYSEIDWS